MINACASRRFTLLCFVQRLDNEQEFLHALPSAEMYERSYMHRDTVTHAVMAGQTEFLITASADGHIKFWKKRPQGIEFAKHFRAHVGPVRGTLSSWLSNECETLSSCNTQCQQA